MKRNFRRQNGFTLIEALVVLFIIALLAVISMTAFDGSRSKAQTLVSFMSQVAGGAQQFRTDTGAYPATVHGLTDSTKAKAFGNTSKDLSSQWQRPYIGVQKAGTTDTDAFMMDKVGVGVEVQIEDFPSGGTMNAGAGKVWYIQATNVPSDIVIQALKECNNGTGTASTETAITAANLNVSKCAGDASAGTFALTFDQTN